MNVRPAEPSDLDALAQLWFEVWQDTHAPILPEGLHKFRTLESFRERMEHKLEHTRVVGPVGAPVGFCAIKGDELDQMYVSPAAQGTGAAAALLADGEARMKAAGVEIAWLACAIGNDRAARFYEKCGWRNAGVMINHAETSEGAYALETWRFEKKLTT
jgi:GNAT superfamily N-acetyltransferase